MRNGIAAIACLVIAGCASMSEEECLTADWQAIGYEDGAYGAPVSAITPRRQACAKKAGMAPDMDAYLAGRREGLERYCTRPNGFAVGARGAAYNGVCDARSAELFLEGYHRGQRLYHHEAAVAGASQAISDAKADLWDVKHRITQAETAVIAPATPHADRLDYILEIKTLSEERSQLEATIIDLTEDRAWAEAELNEYRAALASEGVLDATVTRPRNASY